MKQPTNRSESILIHILKFMLIIGVGLMILALCVEFFSSKETIPASIFVVLLSLSGLCMGWARVNALPEDEQRQVYLSGIDLFTSAMFALSSMPILWVANQFKGKLPTLIYNLLIGWHIALIVLTLILGYRAIARLLSLVKHTHNS